MKNKLLLPIIIVIATIVVTTLATFMFMHFIPSQSRYTIRVGILHSQTGPLAMSELAVIDATILAIDEINAAGGLLGKFINPVIADGASDASTFALQAEKLITKDQVDVIFGCWTSASRKAVKPVIEKHNHLLFYPVQYEGLESSPNIVYTGAAPNQQILPGVTWAFYNLGKTFFLVGSDYIFPRVANELIKDHVIAFGGKIVGEAYQPLNEPHFEMIVQEIVKKQPQVIINTINGSGNISFFKELRRAGITSDKIPTMSFSIAEEELKTLPAQELIGDYATWNYFQSIQRPENLLFIEKFKKKYGESRVTSDPLEAAYFGVHLWAQAVKKAGTAAVEIIGTMIKQQGMDAPEGIVYIDQDNNHTWKMVRVGKINKDRQFDEIWNSKKSIRPIPFPVHGTQNWSELVQLLYKGWNNQWSAE